MKRVLSLVMAVALASAVAVAVANNRSAVADEREALLEFSVKFTCGEMTNDNMNVPDNDEAAQPGTASEPEEGPVVNGRYRTAINFHNASLTDVIRTNPDPRRSEISKKALVLFPQDPTNDPDTQSTEPAFEMTQRPEPFRTPPQNIGPDEGFEIDCEDIREVLLGDPDGGGRQTADPRQDAPFIKGFVVILVSASIAPDVVVANTGYAFAESESEIGEAAFASSQRGTNCEPAEDQGDCDLVQGFTEEIEIIEPTRVR